MPPVEIGNTTPCKPTDACADDLAELRTITTRLAQKLEKDNRKRMLITRKTLTKLVKYVQELDVAYELKKSDKTP